MSTGSLITVENGQSLSDLFHKFIRLTVKPDDREKRFKKRQSVSRTQQQQQQQNPPSSKRSQRSIVQSSNSRVPPRPSKQSSTVAYYNVSPVVTDNHSYSHTDNDEQENDYPDQV